ncbi:MAG: redoxin domain-containing protein [Candidatus Methylomirabilales bacterium]
MEERSFPRIMAFGLRAAVFTILVGFLTFGFSLPDLPAMAGRSPIPLSGLQKPEKITAAPPFLLNDLAGRRMSLSEHRGKVVLVHFWATWCVPCKDELPTVKALWERLKEEGFVVLAIAEDGKKAVEPFVKEYGLTFPVLIDQYGEVFLAYRVWALPSSYVVGKTGNIEGIAVGPRDWTSPEVMHLIRGLLGD